MKFYLSSYKIGGEKEVKKLKDLIPLNNKTAYISNALDFSDLIPAITKSFFFGFAIGLVGCYKGYYCSRGTMGVGEASNAAVVYTSMLLFVIDFIAVFVSDIFFNY